MPGRLHIGPSTRGSAQKLETHTYTRSKGKQLTYTIQVDQWGGYWISLGDKVLKQMGGGMAAYQPYGSKKLRAEGLRAAQLAVENLLEEE